MKTVEGCRIYLLTLKNDFCLRAGSCEVNRNEAQGWSTWMAQNSQRLCMTLNKSPFSGWLHSIISLPLIKIHVGYSRAEVSWSGRRSQNQILTVLPLALRNSVPHYNVGKLQWVPQSRLGLTILSLKKCFVWFVCLIATKEEKKMHCKHTYA